MHSGTDAEILPPPLSVYSMRSCARQSLVAKRPMGPVGLDRRLDWRLAGFVGWEYSSCRLDRGGHRPVPRLAWVTVPAVRAVVRCKRIRGGSLSRSRAGDSEFAVPLKFAFAADFCDQRRIPPRWIALHGIAPANDRTPLVRQVPSSDDLACRAQLLHRSTFDPSRVDTITLETASEPQAANGKP